MQEVPGEGVSKKHKRKSFERTKSKEKCQGPEIFVRKRILEYDQAKAPGSGSSGGPPRRNVKIEPRRRKNGKKRVM